MRVPEWGVSYSSSVVKQVQVGQAHVHPVQAMQLEVMAPHSSSLKCVTDTCRTVDVSSMRRNVFSVSSYNAFLRLWPVNSRSRYGSGATCDKSALPRSDPASTQCQLFPPFPPFL